jgi:heterodisulfide reductase subunit D
MTETFAQALETRAQDVLDRCTSCGKCFEVCPMPAPAGLSSAHARDVVANVLDIIRGGRGSPEAERWAQVCSGSGNCIPACPESVNPRFMLALARVAMQKRATPDEQHVKGSEAFAKMGRGVRVLSRMQLPADVLRRFRSDNTQGARPVEVVFYTGCNVLKTPHIVLLCLDILDALGMSYQVMGGPGDCCGVLQFRTGDLDASGRIAYRTTDRFAASGARKVLAWCPTCTIQLGENVLPGRQSEAVPYGLEAFVVFLANQLDRLKPLMRYPVHKRVGLHEHPGVAGVCESAIRILRAIPGLEYVELDQPQVGYMCNTLQPLPAFKRDVHKTILEAASRARVDALAGVYHACHRELCSHEAEWPFEVVNFLELIGESMGSTREDQFKRLKKMQDTDAIVADVMDLVEEHGLGLDEVRAVIEKDLLGEQPLPLQKRRTERDDASAPG